MVGEIEVLVIHPDRIGEVPWHRLEALPVAGYVGQPVPDHSEHAVDVEAAVRRLE